MTDPDDDQVVEAPSAETDPESDRAEDAPPATLEEKSERTASDRADRRTDWPRASAYGILPGLTLVLALVAGYSKWQESSARSVQIARTESLAAAKESTVAILSYQPDTVEKTMLAARDRLVAPYKDAYTKLTTDVVIPGARQDHVSVIATVPGGASVSANPRHAVAILFVDQAAAKGADQPTVTESSIRVTLEKISGRWLISGFDPI